MVYIHSLFLGVSDLRFWFSKTGRWFNDRVCGHAMVQSTWNHAKLDALQPNRYLMSWRSIIQSINTCLLCYAITQVFLRWYPDLSRIMKYQLSCWQVAKSCRNTVHQVLVDVRNLSINMTLDLSKLSSVSELDHCIWILHHLIFSEATDFSGFESEFIIDVLNMYIFLSIWVGDGNLSDMSYCFYIMAKLPVTSI